MMAEFAHYYGGLPRPEDPWPLVLDATTKTPRFEARRKLTGFVAVNRAINAAFSPNGAGANRDLQDMARQAYPVKADGTLHADDLPNIWADAGAEDDGGADG